MMTAAPSPWMARAAISKVALGATAQAAEATLNRTSPIRNSRRRPKRSPSAAAEVIPAAYARVKALTVHSRVARLACSSRWIAGRAVTTTSESSATMKNAMPVSARVQMDCARVVACN